MSGYLNLEMAEANYQNKDFSKLKLFVSHGTVDQVIPVDWARKSPGILQPLGIETVYKEYPIGHGVSPQNFYDFKNWLLENEA
jgi:phospholipase/carboxylesterase